MQDRFQDVTDAELSVLQILWQSGPANVRQLTDELYPDSSEAYYQTVKKLLERLERKDCVRRDRNNPVHVFEPAIAREDLIGHRLRAVAKSLCDGSLTPLLTHLVNCSDISANDLQSLHSLIEDLNTQTKVVDSERSTCDSVPQVPRPVQNSRASHAQRNRNKKQ